MSGALKPCPFDCGDTPQASVMGGEFVVHLPKWGACPASGTHRLADWNRRAAPPLPALTPEDEAVLTEVAEVLEGEGIYANLLGRVRSLLGRVQAKEPR